MKSARLSGGNRFKPVGVASHDVAQSGYLAVTRREGELFGEIIEDEELAQRVYARMLQAGVPVIRDIRELLPRDAESRQPETS